MYKCNTCGKTGEARNHNGRGLKCTFCWSDNLTAAKSTPNPKPAKTTPPPATPKTKLAQRKRKTN